MTSTKGVLGGLADSSAVDRVKQEARGFVQAQGKNLAQNLTGKLQGVTETMQGAADGGGVLGKTAKKVAEGESPAKAAAQGVAGSLKDKVKQAFGGGGGKPKVTHIMEDIDVGVPVSVAYNQWTQFADFPKFTKGVESVEHEDDVKSTWKVKVFKSGRRLQTKITEQVPDRRIAWTSEGDKGTTKGVITFHPLADDLTRLLLVLEYYPGGFMEKTGNIWRAQGRRARLDLKHFRRHLMMQDEESGSWRGEIREAEVVRTPEEVEEEEQQASGEDRGEQGEEQSQDESQDRSAEDRADEGEESGEESDQPSDKKSDEESDESSGDQSPSDESSESGESQESGQKEREKQPQ
jgi:uncharacterized membrane protein